MSHYYYEDNIQKIKDGIDKYKTRLKPDINLVEHISKFINNYFDLMFYLLEMDLHHIGADKHNIYTRIANTFKSINRIAHNIENHEMSDEDLEECYNSYVTYIDDILFALDMALTHTRFNYERLENVAAPSAKFRSDIIANILSKRRMDKTCSFLDISSSYLNHDSITSLLSNRTEYENVNYYVWRDSLEQYYRMKDITYRFIAGPSDTCKISNNVFDIVYSAPNYSQYSTTKLTSSEKDYVRNAIKYAKYDGIIILEYNRCRLTKDICSLLAKYLYNVNIISAPTAPFETVFIIGNKRRDKVADQELYNRLRQLHTIEEPLEADLSNIYISPVCFEVDIFKGTLFNDEMKNTICNDSKLLESLYENLLKKDTGVQDKHPLLPFSVGQLGLVLTSGCLNGIIEELDEEQDKKYYHVIKGCVIKQTEKVMNGTLVSEETISNKVNINIITPNGEIMQLA